MPYNFHRMFDEKFRNNTDYDSACNIQSEYNKINLTENVTYKINFKNKRIDFNQALKAVKVN